MNWAVFTSLFAGTFLMSLAFYQHGWWGFAFLPLAFIIMGCTRVAFEI